VKKKDIKIHTNGEKETVIITGDNLTALLEGDARLLLGATRFPDSNFSNAKCMFDWFALRGVPEIPESELRKTHRLVILENLNTPIGYIGLEANLDLNTNKILQYNVYGGSEFMFTTDDFGKAFERYTKLTKGEDGKDISEDIGEYMFKTDGKGNYQVYLHKLKSNKWYKVVNGDYIETTPPERKKNKKKKKSTPVSE